MKEMLELEGEKTHVRKRLNKEFFEAEGKK